MSNSPQALQSVRFLNALSELGRALRSLKAQAAAGTITQAEADKLVKRQLQIAENNLNQLNEYYSQNRAAIRQELGLDATFKTLINNFESLQDNIEDFQRDILFRNSVKKQKFTETDAQRRFAEIKATFQALEKQVEIAEDRCARGFKAEADAAFNQILNTGGGADGGGGFPSINNELLRLSRLAREAGLKSVVTEVDAFQSNVAIAIRQLDAAKNRCSRRLPVAASPGLGDIANTFQNLQAQAEIASNNCDLDPSNKVAALNSMELVYKGYEDLAKTISDLRITAQTVKNTTLDRQLQTIAEQITQAIADLQVAQKRCQDSGITPSVQGLEGEEEKLRAQAALQDAYNAKLKDDWRVRITLAPMADGYLYKVPPEQAGILAPLQETDGVIFPYTPDIGVNYAAKYETVNPTHSNYMFPQYQHSSVDSVTINCEFTAQDTKEANYLLAVIHFFRAATKMFYGQDENPKPGLPPPILYLHGLGAYQFDNHPMVLQTFNYNLPNDVDYIRATGFVTTPPGVNKGPLTPADNVRAVSDSRMQLNGNRVSRNGLPSPPNFSQLPQGTVQPTYVPTKIRMQLQFLPIVSRYDISKNWSFRDYATGRLLQGSKNYTGGIW